MQNVRNMPNALAVIVTLATSLARKVGPWVTLRPRGRIARYHGAPIVVTVGLGYPEPAMFGGDVRHYGHPEVHFRTLDTKGETTTYGGLDLTMTFQRHSPPRDLHDRGPRGWMAGDVPWSHCYAPSITSHLEEYRSHAKALTRTIELVAKARAACPERARRRGDDLLTLLVGLRHIGVEVRVYSKRIDTLRASR